MMVNSLPRFIGKCVQWHAQRFQSSSWIFLPASIQIPSRQFSHSFVHTKTSSILNFLSRRIWYSMMCYLDNVILQNTAFPSPHIVPPLHTRLCIINIFNTNIKGGIHCYGKRSSVSKTTIFQDEEPFLYSSCPFGIIGECQSRRTNSLSTCQFKWWSGIMDRQWNYLQ